MNPFSFYKTHKNRCRNFYTSSIAGLFSGIIIGLFFILMTDSTFNRWINLFGYELLVSIIFFGLILLFLWLGYWIGKGLVFFLIAKDKDDLVSFKINYFAGTYSTAFSSSLLILHNHFAIASYFTIFFILMYFPINYFAVKE